MIREADPRARVDAVVVTYLPQVAGLSSLLALLSTQVDHVHADGVM